MYTARHAVPPGKYDFKVFSHIITRENAIKNFRRKLCLAWSTVSLESYFNEKNHVKWNWRLVLKK